MEYMSIVDLKLELSTFEGGWSWISAAYPPDLNQVNARRYGLSEMTHLRAASPYHADFDVRLAS
jgi:hypothetical protein